MTGMALPRTQIVVLLCFISLTTVTVVIFSHSDILHLRTKIKSVLSTPKTELNEQTTPCQNEVEGFVKVQVRREGRYDWCARTLHRSQRSTFLLINEKSELTIFFISKFSGCEVNLKIL